MDNAPLIVNAAQPSATAGMETFDEKVYDVTNYCESGCILLSTLGLAGCTKKTLRLEAEEAVLNVRNNCVNRTSKRPYAQLGSVDSIQACCCWAVASNIEEGQGPDNLSPGWGCEQEKVQELVRELQARKVGRGNIAQIKAQEVLAMRVDHLHAKMDAILAHLHVDPPPPPAMGSPVPVPETIVRGHAGSSADAK